MRRNKHASGNSAEGLRTRKKKETRHKIAKVAAKLFRSRGYDNVRMKDIALAADVSEQTLYNYFPGKEHLIFDQQQEFEERIVNTVTGKPDGVPLSEALRHHATQFLHDLSRNVGKTTGISSDVATGAELRRVWIEMNARHADSLTQALLESGWTDDRPTAKFVARSVVALFAVIFEGVGEAIISGKSRSAIRRELSSAIDSMTALVALGLDSI
jgi:AcrR family transcriptional regulator